MGSIRNSRIQPRFLRACLSRTELRMMRTAFAVAALVAVCVLCAVVADAAPAVADGNNVCDMSWCCFMAHITRLRACNAYGCGIHNDLMDGVPALGLPDVWTSLIDALVAKA